MVIREPTTLINFDFDVASACRARLEHFDPFEDPKMAAAEDASLYRHWNGVSGEQVMRHRDESNDIMK